MPRGPRPGVRRRPSRRFGDRRRSHDGMAATGSTPRQLGRGTRQPGRRDRRHGVCRIGTTRRNQGRQREAGCRGLARCGHRPGRRTGPTQTPHRHGALVRAAGPGRRAQTHRQLSLRRVGLPQRRLPAGLVPALRRTPPARGSQGHRCTARGRAPVRPRRPPPVRAGAPDRLPAGQENTGRGRTRLGRDRRHARRHPRRRIPRRARLQSTGAPAARRRGRAPSGPVGVDR